MFSIKTQIRCVLINWARGNKLRLCDASLCQKPMRLLGNVYMLAVSKMLLLQTMESVAFWKKKNRGVWLKCSSWPINRFSGMSAVGDVYSHSEVKMRHSSPSKLMLLQQQPWPQRASYVWERQQTRIFWEVRQPLFAKAVSISWDMH